MDEAGARMADEDVARTGQRDAVSRAVRSDGRRFLHHRVHRRPTRPAERLYPYRSQRRLCQRMRASPMSSDKRSARWCPMRPEAGSNSTAPCCTPARRSVSSVSWSRPGAIWSWLPRASNPPRSTRSRCCSTMSPPASAPEQALQQLNETLEARVAETLAERRVLADIVEGTDAFVQVADTDFRWLAINTASAREFERIFGVMPKSWRIDARPARRQARSAGRGARRSGSVR